MLFKVVLPLRHQHCRCAHSHAHIQRQITGAVAHDLHHGAALMGLHGVPQPVDALHRRVGGGIEADGVVGTDDIVVDGTRDAYHGDAELGQVLCAAERTVAADSHQAVQSQQLAGVGRLLLALLSTELVAPCAVQDGAAAVDDAADAGAVHLHDVAGDQAGVAPPDAHALDAASQRTADHGTDAGVHARCVSAAGQHADTLDCIVHKISTSFLAAGARRCPLLLHCPYCTIRSGCLQRPFHETCPAPLVPSCKFPLDNPAAPRYYKHMIRKLIFV